MNANRNPRTSQKSQISADYTDYADFALGVSRVWVLKSQKQRIISTRGDDFVEPGGHIGLVRLSSVLDRFKSPSARGTVFDRIRSP
jgi:hypothetical protein